jgi:hypothetical protein
MTKSVVKDISSLIVFLASIIRKTFFLILSEIFSEPLPTAAKVVDDGRYKLRWRLGRYISVEINLA